MQCIYIRDVREVVAKKFKLTSGRKEVLFHHEYVVGLDGSWEEHAMTQTYLIGMYSGFLKMTMPNMSEDMF